MGIPMLNIRRSWDWLFYNMGIPIPVRWYLYIEMAPGPGLNIKTIFPSYGITMLKIRRSWDRLIFSMGIPILARQSLYWDGPQIQYKDLFFCQVMRIPIKTLIQEWEHLIFIMGIPMLVRSHVYSEVPFKIRFLINSGIFIVSMANIRICIWISIAQISKCSQCVQRC